MTFPHSPPIFEKAPEIVEDVLKEKGIRQELQRLGERDLCKARGQVIRSNLQITEVEQIYYCYEFLDRVI